MLSATQAATDHVWRVALLLFFTDSVGCSSRVNLPLVFSTSIADYYNDEQQSISTFTSDVPQVVRERVKLN